MDQSSPKTASVVLHAVGDVGFTGEVMRRVRDSGGDYPFARAKKVLAEADVVFGNLEIPVLEPGARSDNPIIPQSLVATTEAIAPLRTAGFSVMTLANNHIMDHGVAGLRSSLRALRANGIGTVGAGENLGEARRPWIATVRGLRLGILAYTESAGTWAGADSPGAAPMQSGIVDADIAALRPVVDILVLSLHFGMMYTDYPAIEHQDQLRRWVLSGANVILGHHPHVCQGIEEYSGGLIAYSLGEFVFDPRSGNVVSERSLEIRRRTMVLRCRFAFHGLESWDYVPFTVGPNLEPIPALGDEGRKVRERIDAISQALEGDRLRALDPSHRGDERLARHELNVLWFHLRRFHLGYLASRALRVRRKHFAMFWQLIRRSLK